MRLKRYLAPTMPEGLRIVRQELGENAVILSTRKVKLTDGKTGLEITAAVDPTSLPPSPRNTPEKPTGYTAESLVHGTAAAQLEHLLASHGVALAVSQKIARAAEALADTGFSTEDALEMVLGKMVRFVRPAQVQQPGKPLLLVGPTGAGKTTTLAKLAIERRRHGHSIGFITMDTYKIGGAAQLRIYAEALKEPLHTVKTAADLHAALAALKDKEFVFIDTAGINPFERSRMDDLTTLTDGLSLDVALVLPSNLNTLELNTLPKAFAPLHPSLLLFSKLDETAHLGGLVNAAVGSHLPLCYATDGQRVPQDLLELDAQSLSRRLLAPPRLPWEETA
jgi:flagellar biosynthesis protein FlhF